MRNRHLAKYLSRITESLMRHKAIAAPTMCVRVQPTLHSGYFYMSLSSISLCHGFGIQINETLESLSQQSEISKETNLEHQI
jgi:hypothetical protein